MNRGKITGGGVAGGGGGGGGESRWQQRTVHVYHSGAQVLLTRLEARVFFTLILSLSVSLFLLGTRLLANPV